MSGGRDWCRLSVRSSQWVKPEIGHPGSSPSSASQGRRGGLHVRCIMSAQKETSILSSQSVQRPTCHRHFGGKRRDQDILCSDLRPQMLEQSRNPNSSHFHDGNAHRERIAIRSHPCAGYGEMLLYRRRPEQEPTGLNPKDQEKPGTELNSRYNKSKGPEEGRRFGPWKNRNEAGMPRDEGARETVGQAGAGWAAGSHPEIPHHAEIHQPEQELKFHGTQRVDSYL